MKKVLLLAFVAATSLLSTAAMAQKSNLNLEPECSTSGSGMDPRCVGVSNPGTDGRAMRSGKRVRSHQAMRHRHAVRTHRTARRHMRTHRSAGVTNGSAACNRANMRQDPRCLD